MCVYEMCCYVLIATLQALTSSASSSKSARIEEKKVSFASDDMPLPPARENVVVVSPNDVGHGACLIVCLQCLFTMHSSKFISLIIASTML